MVGAAARPEHPEPSRELEREATIRERMQRFRNLTSEELTALRYG
ncbi:hypothetical protein [Solemya pervernicosa gill symbiont]|nr:hypothetical protein [Solemya pervernicosa gill symbiont]